MAEYDIKALIAAIKKTRAYPFRNNEGRIFMRVNGDEYIGEFDGRKAVLYYTLNSRILEHPLLEIVSDVKDVFDRFEIPVELHGNIGKLNKLKSLVDKLHSAAAKSIEAKVQ